MEVDISLAHSWVICFKRNLQQREEEKELKYLKDLLPLGIAPRVMPLVFEHFGNLGVQESKDLDDLCKRSSVDDEGQPNQENLRPTGDGILVFHYRNAMQK